MLAEYDYRKKLLEVKEFAYFDSFSPTSLNVAICGTLGLNDQVVSLLAKAYLPTSSPIFDDNNTDLPEAEMNYFDKFYDLQVEAKSLYKVAEFSRRGKLVEIEESFNNLNKLIFSLENEIKQASESDLTSMLTSIQNSSAISSLNLHAINDFFSTNKCYAQCHKF